MLLILHDDLFALGTAGGGNIGRCDKRGVLSAQKLCISEQIRRPGFPALRQPIDPIVTLQGAALHFTAAVWTNHILTLSVPGGFRLPGTPVIFAAACTWRKFPDSAALGGALTIFRSGGASPLRNSDARATGRGSSAVRGRGGIGPAVPPRAARRVRIQGGCNPPWKGFNTSARPSRARDGLRKRPGSPDARTLPCHPRATRNRSRRSWSWAAP